MLISSIADSRHCSRNDKGHPQYFNTETSIFVQSYIVYGDKTKYGNSDIFFADICIKKYLFYILVMFMVKLILFCLHIDKIECWNNNNNNDDDKVYKMMHGGC